MKKYNDNIDEVIIFYAPRLNKWIVRQSTGIFRIGDSSIEHEPSDKEIKNMFSFFY